MAADSEEWHSKIVDKTGSFTKMPSAQEYAASKGIKVTPENEIDKSKLGEIGRASELESNEEAFNQDGSFLWSF
jgi:hypothetical protein